MSGVLLNTRARLIVRQRLIEAEESRRTSQASALRRTKRKLQQTVASGLQSGLAMDVIITEFTSTLNRRSLVPTK